MKLLSSIIKNYRTLQGNVITIGGDKVDEPLLHLNEKQYEETGQVAQQLDFIYLEEEAKKEALRIVEEAKKQAQALLDEAALEKENSMNRFYTEKANLEARAKAEYENILEEASREREAILQQAYVEREALLKQAEPEVVEIMTHLLHKIIDAKIVSGKEWLTLFVQQVIEKEQLRENIKVFLSPHSFEKHSATLAENFATLPIQVQLEIDRRLSDGECVIETNTGTIAYNIADGLQQVIDEMQLLCGKR